MVGLQSYLILAYFYCCTWNHSNYSSWTLVLSCLFHRNYSSRGWSSFYSFFVNFVGWTFQETSYCQTTWYSHLELLELSYDYFPCLVMPFYCQFPIFDLCSCQSLNFKFHYFTLMILFSSLKQNPAPSNLCQIFRLDFIYSEVSYLIKMCLLLNIYVSKILQFYHLDYYFQNFVSRRFLMKRIASYLMKYFR